MAVDIELYRNGAQQGSKVAAQADASMEWDHFGQSDSPLEESWPTNANVIEAQKEGRINRLTRIKSVGTVTKKKTPKPRRFEFSRVSVRPEQMDWESGL